MAENNKTLVEEKVDYLESEKILASDLPAPAQAKAPKSRRKVLLVVLGAIVLVGLVVGGIVWSKQGVVTVQTAKVVRQDLSSIVTASGQIEPPPEKLANVNANSFGKITEVTVKEGDRVKKGQLLLRTEDVQQAANVDAQEAAVKTSMADVAAQEAAVESAGASLKTAGANLAQAQAKYKQAKDDYTRGQQLFKDELIARQVFDQRLSDYEVAQANLQSAQAQVAQSKALYQQAAYNRDMASARVNQSRAQLMGFQNQLAQTIYTSPLDGIVTSLPVHLGENVVPGIQNQPGSVLFQIADLSTITAEVMVDETDIVNVKLGQPAEVTIDAIPNKTFKGRVTQIGQSAVSSTTGLTTTTTGSANQEAKDFKVVITLDNPPSGLRPGLSATGKTTTATRQNAVTIPIQALTIRTRGELEESEKKPKGKTVAASDLSAKEQARLKEEVQGVFVVRSGRAQFVPLETGIMGETNVEVLKGTQPGDEIITGPYQVLRTLKNNTKVKINNTAPMPGTTSAPPSS